MKRTGDLKRQDGDEIDGEDNDDEDFLEIEPFDSRRDDNYRSSEHRDHVRRQRTIEEDAVLLVLTDHVALVAPVPHETRLLIHH